MGHNPLELAVLLFQRLQPLGVGHFHSTVLAALLVEHRVRNPVFPQFLDRVTRFGLLQALDSLLL